MTNESAGKESENPCSEHKKSRYVYGCFECNPPKPNEARATQPTKGPWEVQSPMEDQDGSDVIVSCGISGSYPVICEMSYEVPPEEREANAFLLAAAPELLKYSEALIEALKNPDRTDKLGAAILHLAGAIARAKIGYK